MKKTRLVIVVIILWFWAAYLSIFRKRLAKKNIVYCYKHYMLKTSKLVRWTYNIDFQVIGQDHITDEPQLIVLNHKSYADSTLAIASFVSIDSDIIRNKPVIYIAKLELNKTFIYRSFVRLLKVIFLIDRNNLRQSVTTVRNIAKLSWQEKLSIVIFAEGTRNKTDKPLLPLKPGSLKLALLNKMPILPGVLINSDKVWDFKRKKRITVKLVYGKAIPAAEAQRLSSQELSDLVSKRMIKLIEDNSKDN